MIQTPQPVGTLLRGWRQRRRLTQLDLALDADISPRHLSFVETGRAQPSREMLLHLSEELDIPLRERNTLLVAAGFAPMFRERPLEDAALAAARRAIDVVLEAQKPFPAFALDRHWNIVATNHALPQLFEGAAAELLAPPVNAMRLALHPKGVAPRIANLAEWRAHLLARLRRQVGLTADPALAELQREVSGYEREEAGSKSQAGLEQSVLVPLQVRTSLGLLSFLSTTTVFGTPVDVTLSELAIELFFPADAATADAVRGATPGKVSGPRDPGARVSQRSTGGHLAAGKSPAHPFRENPMKRRGFLTTTLASGASLALPAFAQAPAIITSERMRPQATSGLQIGDVTGGSALVWSRADRPARMLVERSFHADFRDAVRVRGPLALETSDYTARLDLTGLPPGREVFVRVMFEDLSSAKALSEPVSGTFRTAPADRRGVTFAWSGDTAGQGWGINREWGGMKCYETVRRDRPDFFVHCGDTIYADGPIAAEVQLAGNGVWKNLVTEEVSKVAESLKEFRGRYAYNLMDENVRRLSAEVPQVWQWDDHEVTNNWSDSKDLSGDARYTEKNVALLTARATRAFLEWAPLRWHGADESERVYRRIAYGPLLDLFVIDMRSYRGPNSYNRQETPGPDTAFLGETQLAWLKDGLARSKARWKVISADMPVGLLVGDGKDVEGRDRFEAVANGDGPPLGREFEFANLFSFLKRQKIQNVVWITADVHYCAAHYYDPAKAQFSDFNPFWEFVAGPMHAGGFGPNPLDNTFGPRAEFVKAPAGRVNVPPTEGGQFYGLARVDGKTGALRVQLKDLTGAVLFEKTLTYASRR